MTPAAAAALPGTLVLLLRTTFYPAACSSSLVFGVTVATLPALPSYADLLPALPLHCCCVACYCGTSCLVIYAGLPMPYCLHPLLLLLVVLCLAFCTYCLPPSCLPCVPYLICVFPHPASHTYLCVGALSQVALFFLFYALFLRHRTCTCAQ